MGQSSAQAVEDADLVVLASPVGTFEPIVREIAPHLKNGAILTDVGSVKGARQDIEERILRAFIMSRAIRSRAGKSTVLTKPSNTLFQGACILTPTARTDPQALEAVKRLWTAAGMNVVVMDADRTIRSLPR